MVVPRLRFKLDLLKLHADFRSDRELAEHLGIKPPTLAGYLADSGTSPRNSVSRDTFQALCKLTVNTVNHSITEQEAEALLLASESAFCRAFNTKKEASLSAFFEQYPQNPLLKLHVIPQDHTFGMVEFLTTDDQQQMAHAVINDSIYLECNGVPGWFVIVLVEIPPGFLLIAPRNGEPLRIPQNGSIRVPAARKGLKLVAPGGHHRFYALCIDSNTPPHITKKTRPISVLSSTECDQLMDDLTNASITRQWVVGHHDLFVREDNTPI